ncbi:hypothetical protein Cgig2_025366 [Carnegiea gigantea]|uniref:Uncharacterized protein n=1 Tax=Carnegiea gigantea TaxID=171969 RepID=A0A9Q1GK80_9CARY|nr:hypothetical protein Cgig2_025366 [Carnegiea gigantea]
MKLKCFCNFMHVIVIFDCQFVFEKVAKIGNEPSFLQMFRETHKRGTEFATPEIVQNYVAEKVFKSKSRSQVVGLGGGVKPKDVRGSYSTRTELEVELNAIRRKNEVLTDCLATVEAENEKLQNRVESVETEMMKIKDLVFQQFNTHPPSIARSGHEILVILGRYYAYCLLVVAAAILGRYLKTLDADHSKF